MADKDWIVVKVGGSLFSLPNLRERLSNWLDQLRDVNVLLVPGGGAMADAVRALDAVHQLGEEESHWLAIAAMSVNARFLHALLPTTRLASRIPDLASERDGGRFVLDAQPFFQADEKNADHLPHSWQITSDSLAIRVATVLHANELILLKSIDFPGNDWIDAARIGVVDGYFAEALSQTAANLRVRIVNARAWG